MKFSISRYDPERDAKPYTQDFVIELLPSEHMLLDVILRLKQQDPTLSFRKSCREGVCGSDAMNINGRNGLACITRVRELKEPVVIRPLPGFPIIRDIVVDMTQFYKQYHSIKPYLVNAEPPPEKERLQSPDERERLNGSYECILCACCSSQCPSYWWNPDKFVGPAGLIQAYRFIVDSRDQATEERLDDLSGAYRLFRCRTIMNCAEVCPKGLEPVNAIERIRLKMSGAREEGGALHTRRFRQHSHRCEHLMACVGGRTDGSPALVSGCGEEIQHLAIHHTLSGEPLAIRPIGSAITSARTVTLYQTRQFEEKTAQLNGESAW